MLGCRLARVSPPSLEVLAPAALEVGTGGERTNEELQTGFWKTLFSFWTLNFHTMNRDIHVDSEGSWRN